MLSNHAIPLETPGPLSFHCCYDGHVQRKGGNKHPPQVGRKRQTQVLGYLT